MRIASSAFRTCTVEESNNIRALFSCYGTQRMFITMFTKDLHWTLTGDAHILASVLRSISIYIYTHKYIYVYIYTQYTRRAYMRVQVKVYAFLKCTSARQYHGT